MIVPKRNEKDLPDVPEEVRDTLKFHFVENIDEVLEIALGTARKKKARATPGKAANGEQKQPRPRRARARPRMRTPGASATT